MGTRESEHVDGPYDDGFDGGKGIDSDEPLKTAAGLKILYVFTDIHTYFYLHD